MHNGLRTACRKLPGMRPPARWVLAWKERDHDAAVGTADASTFTYGKQAKSDSQVIMRERVSNAAQLHSNNRNGPLIRCWETHMKNTRRIPRRAAAMWSNVFPLIFLTACGNNEMTPEQLYNYAQPAIVLIETAPTQASPPGEPESPECQSTPFFRGSGFVIDEVGLIATNAHVADPCPQGWPDLPLTVKTASGDILPAQVVGIDHIGDLAVLRVDHQFKTALDFADSKNVRPGQEAIALGFPGFLDGEATITRGIVSVASRSFNNLGGVVQTDAAVNHGNSGGPLLNIRGEVIGINTAIYRPMADFEAINFAISSRIVQRQISDILAYGEVKRADLGPIRFNVYDGSATVQSNTEANPYSLGFLLSEVQATSPLAGKLSACDMIDSINGESMRSYGDYYNAMLWAEAGKPMSIGYVHYPAGKCQIPDPCAFKTGPSAWGTGCPMDPLRSMRRQQGSIEEMFANALTAPIDTSDPENEQARIDEEAMRILDNRRDRGVLQFAEIVPN